MTSTTSKEPEEHPSKSVRRKVTSPHYGCDHYKRNCEFYTPCCQKTYRCRFCHDQMEQHVLQREDVQELVCSTCATRQDVRKDCRSCGVIFGKYFCFECKLFDDEDKQQFHCDGCGICRIGGRENFFHCPTCNMCLPKHLEGNHRCIENLSRANCPICQEDIHTSREPSQIPPCNHLIHKSCFDQLVRSGHFFCPVCAHSLVDMRDMWKLYDQQIDETPLPAVYQSLFALSYCRDCLKTSRSSFHILGIKCSHCSGYNTVREKGPLLRLVEGTFIEANLVEEVTRGMNAEDALNMDLSPVQSRADSSPILADPQMERIHNERFRIQETSAEEWDSRSGGAVSNLVSSPPSSRGILNDPVEDEEVDNEEAK
ncbi:RING finger and CHY zinc finger domain-containing protein 1-like [Tigriopus californicus]|uniref:RING finger and CHY zinc finger domain-containing protein 1-like n=1 Tax=Tigriopus californicus TaxID=6832 RepID=UPI0027DAA136|nr:RING finger and CHY zinc finger domain-containing protein 1-like [Tigriopus californicus]